MNLKLYKRILPVLLALLAIPGMASSAVPVRAQSSANQAGLVLQFPDGTTQSYCILFDGDSISGLDALLKTGLDVKVQAYGGLGAEICEIGATGCDYPNQACACQSYGPGGVYWSYHHLKNGKWVSSVTGAGSYRLHNGDVDGWAYSSGTPPKVYTFAELCPAQPPQPAPTDTPTPLPPTATATTTTQPSPTHTQRPAQPTLTHKPKPSLTPTRQPTQPTPTTQAEPTTEEAPFTPTMTPQPPDTATTAPSPTATLPQSTGTSTPTSTPTQTPTTFPTTFPTATPPIPTVTPEPPNPEDTARGVGLVIAGGVVVSLALWGALVMRRRGTEGNGHVE